MSKAVVIGAGINGLVAANYLRRAGLDVTLLERKENVGGACTFDTFTHEGRSYPFPTGASVFGFMQDFVFKETGLDRSTEVYRPKHPSVVYFGNETAPAVMHEDPERQAKELMERWGERGTVAAFNRDMDRVRDHLIEGFREAAAPTWEGAVSALGEEMARLWISGPASRLLDTYFTSDQMKIYQALPVTESGPVPLDSPFSAFSIPLMSAGSVFDGWWGFVKGGLWTLVRKLGELNEAQGVKVICGATVSAVDPATGSVTYRTSRGESRASGDALFFATDPLSAARMTNDAELLARVSGKRFLGSSGKLVLLFREPVVWKHSTGARDFESAFRFFYAVDTVEAFRRSSEKVRARESQFSPCSFQVYCEGAAMRQMGWNEPYDYLSVFFKDLAWTEPGAALPRVKEEAMGHILPRIENPGALMGAVLLTPKDLTERFFFPEGNIDHMELCDGQTFLARTFSPNPAKRFHQFGNSERLFYCGAGSYPCGSIAGTAGYLAAREWLS